MYLIAIAWAYVVVLMALAEGFSASGTWLGATITFLLYGVLPLGITLYLFATPSRRARQRRSGARAAVGVDADPDRSGHPAGDALATKGEEA